MDENIVYTVLQEQNEILTRGIGGVPSSARRGRFLGSQAARWRAARLRLGRLRGRRGLAVSARDRVDLDAPRAVVHLAIKSELRGEGAQDVCRKCEE